MKDIKNIKRISIIGGPGTGKSTLANNLGRNLELPVYHIDAINYLENWKERDKKERDEIILKKIEESKWIIDGTYKSTLENRVSESDLIIFLKYSTIAKLKGIFSRYLKNKGKGRNEIPGCKEKMEWNFIKLTIIWNKTKGSIIDSILEKYKDKNIIIFRNRRQLNKWYGNEFKKKIELE